MANANNKTDSPLITTRCLIFYITFDASRPGKDAA
jgi:hypothetical protein